MKTKTPSKGGFSSTGGSKKPLVSAKSKAVSLLARREHSQTELRGKLMQRGYEVAEVEEAIQWATSHQFQSDERFKLSLFRRRAPTFGDRAISAELGQHGLGSVKSLNTEEAEEQSLESEEDRAYEWIMRRQGAALQVALVSPETQDSEILFKLKSKIYKALSARGFEFGNIERAWRRILAELNSNA